MATGVNDILVESGEKAIPIIAICSQQFPAWLGAQPPEVRTWLTQTGFKPDSAAFSLVPNEAGSLSQVTLGLGDGDDIWTTGSLARALPSGRYRIAEVRGAARDFANWAALAWGLGAYRFARYKGAANAQCAQLEWPQGCDRSTVQRAIAAATLTRDLVNTPASDMLPDRFEQVAREVAQAHGASIRVVSGDELRDHYPMIHAVGRASAVGPRLIDLKWGVDSDPKVTLVGKGVCFDSGGLDIKSPSDMALMKRDMGGAATMIGLAQMIMQARLPIRLRLLLAAVENAIAGNAYRPGDILRSRKGLTVEVGNTDAEGRLILADALADAASEKPELLIDCATLTGSCLTALGPDLPGLFTDDELLARDLLEAAERAYDPLWRLPLWSPYRKYLDSKIADINNMGDPPHGGAITAALFLREFVKSKHAKVPDIPWAHLDLFAWNLTERAGRPRGGEALGQRALFELIDRRFGRAALACEAGTDSVNQARSSLASH